MTSDTPLRAIRQKCLDCCTGSIKAIRFCTCDGLNSTACPLWPFRFGTRPATAKRRKMGPMSPIDNQHASVPLEKCLQGASEIKS